MSRDWTDAQNDAINSRNGSVLVSAAAGSGKTAVLVERVIKRLVDEKNSTNIENILIVTFTKPAASEMLEKIIKALDNCIKQNPNNSSLKRQKMFVPSANICTIDSYCNKIVKENCQLLDITPDFAILDSNDITLLENDIANEILEELYIENSTESNALLELFTDGKDDSNLTKAILKIYKFSMASANPEKWIENHFAHYFEDTPIEQTVWGQYSLERVKAIVEHTLAKCNKILLDAGDDNDVGVAAKKSINGTIVSLKEILNLINNFGQWDNIKSLIDKLSKENFTVEKTCEKDEFYHEIHGRVLSLKNDFECIQEVMSCYVEDFENDIKTLRPAMVTFKKCVLDFLTKLFEAKKAKNAYDYPDILHMALDLLVKQKEDGTYEKTPLAVDISKKYDEILIDECQDTNEAQDTLFNAISKNMSNLFMVGDVKQSIYRFRHAVPEIFMGYKDKYDVYDKKLDNYPSKILLDKNFRSRKGIVDGVNFFFDYLMTRKMGDVDYKNGDELVVGAKYSKTDNRDVCLHIVNGPKSHGSNLEYEITYVGKTIKDIIASGMKIFDKEEKVERQVSFKDICILSRSLKNKGDKIAKGLTQMGVPVHYEKNKGFFENAEIMAMISLLNVIDNPVQDVPLLAVMLSPMFSFTEDDIARMRCNNRYGSFYDLLKENYNTDSKAKYFLDTIYQLRMLSVTLGVGDLIRRALEITLYDSAVGAMVNGEKHILNLQLLIHYAEQFEANGGHGLSGFVRYVDKLRKNEFDLDESNLVSGNDDAVILTTIHASKGLEYPIVFMVDCGDSFGVTEKNKVVVDRTMGIGTRCYDKTRNIEYDTQMFSTIKMKNKLEELSEEVRIHYVAMTRAREKLYIVGNLYKAEEKIKEIYNGFYVGNKDNSVSLSLTKNFISWAILAMFQHPSTRQIRDDLGILNCHEIITDSKIDFQVIEPVELEDEDLGNITNPPVDNDILDEVNKKVNYEYPYAAFANMPIKYSASRISEKAQTTYIATENPAFMGKDELTPAQRGTLAHRFMEKCDFTLAKQSVENEVARLNNIGVFTDVEVKSIDINKIAKFFESDLYNRIENAETYAREKEFTMNVPLSFIKNDLPTGAGDESVVLQGIMDGLIINGKNGEIVDYKTDNVSNEKELCDRYREQMQAYKVAAEQCFGLQNVNVTLYSFSLSKEISLNLEKNT